MKNKNRFMRLQFLLMGVFLVFAISCDADTENVPVLTTTEVTEITETTAMSGGNITDDGGATVTARGVCWSINENPTVEDNKSEDGTGAGSFTSSITDLEPNTTYYVSAYATNSAGTGYGEQRSFVSIDFGSFTDTRDGKVYKTVVIGNQEWMAENLAYAPSSGNYWAYDNDDANVEVYGYLYDWQTAINVCPTGWHLPSDEEWSELTFNLGEKAGGKLKATGTIEAGTGIWYDPNTGATNETGFTALPGGRRDFDGEFSSIGYGSTWWSATEIVTAHAWVRMISYNYSGVVRYDHSKELGFSVRCLSD